MDEISGPFYLNRARSTSKRLCGEKGLLRDSLPKPSLQVVPGTLVGLPRSILAAAVDKSGATFGFVPKDTMMLSVGHAILKS